MPDLDHLHVNKIKSDSKVLDLLFVLRVNGLNLLGKILF